MPVKSGCILPSGPFNIPGCLSKIKTLGKQWEGNSVSELRPGSYGRRWEKGSFEPQPFQALKSILNPSGTKYGVIQIILLVNHSPAAQSTDFRLIKDSQQKEIGN